MNFKQWHKKEMFPIIGDYYENRLEESWNACKNEILNILKEKIVYSREEGDIIYPNVIKEIENL